VFRKPFLNALLRFRDCFELTEGNTNFKRNAGADASRLINLLKSFRYAMRGRIPATGRQTVGKYVVN
jgi:hypothetical protein